MEMITFDNGLTVKDLKNIINQWPEIDNNGDDCEVWIQTSTSTSSIALSIIPLNVRYIDGVFCSDILIGC